MERNSNRILFERTPTVQNSDQHVSTFLRQEHFHSSSVDTVKHAHDALANSRRSFQIVDHAEGLNQQKVIEKVLQARFRERYLERQFKRFVDFLFHLVELVRRVFRCKLRSQVLQFKHEFGLQLLF